MSEDPFAGRHEITAEEYRAYLSSAGQTVFVPPVAGDAVPDWQTNEKAFMAKVVKFATEHGWEDIYHTYRSASSSPGFPDLVMGRGWRLEVAELKVGDNKPTRQQERWLDRFRAIAGAARERGFDGIGVRVWWPEDVEEIEEVLR